MIPSSFNQIVQTGRMRQGALQAEAERERRSMQAVAAEDAPAETAGEQRAEIRSVALPWCWTRFAAALGTLTRSLRSAS